MNCLVKLIRNMPHWTQGLLTTMKDPNYIVTQTPKLVAFKDKFPKAKHHYLICPYEDIDNLYDLRKEHVQLVEEMQELAKLVIASQGQQLENFKIGFHAIPSMSRLHLHVISQDFISPCLKTKAHWNSFTTNFLIPPERITKDLNTLGKVTVDPGEAECFLTVALTCNSCSYKAKSMPDLKKHLLQHESLYKGIS